MSNEDLTTIPTTITGSMTRPKSLEDSRDGTSGISIDEVQFPRLAIAQGLSPQLVPTEGVFIRGLTIGEMFNDVTGTVYGNGPLTVIPVKRHVTRIEFDPNDRKVPLDRDVPAGDPRLRWDGVNPPRATEFVEFVCLVLRDGVAPEKVVVSIKTTNKYQRAAAKLWTTLIVMREAAIYSGLYALTSKIEKGKNKQGQETMFGVFVVKNAGFIPVDTPQGAALYAYAKGFADSLAGKTVVVERDSVDEDATVGDTTFDTSAM